MASKTADKAKDKDQARVPHGRAQAEGEHPDVEEEKHRQDGSRGQPIQRNPSGSN